MLQQNSMPYKRPRQQSTARIPQVQNGHSTERSFTSACLSLARKNNLGSSCGLCSAALRNCQSRTVVYVLMKGEREQETCCLVRAESREWGCGAHGNCCCVPAWSSGAAQFGCESPHCPTPHPPSNALPFAYSRTLIKPNWITHTHTYGSN